MGIIITNGSHYIYYSETGGIKKTADINEAYMFPSIGSARRVIQGASNKAKGYYVYDTETEQIRWKKHRRKQYTEDVRKMIYEKADGCCQLCGRKLTYEEMTLDHIVPLSMGGIDSVNNLQCAHEYCNQFKGSVLPSELVERISEIFRYQMGKKYGGCLRWKIMNRMLRKMV